MNPSLPAPPERWWALPELTALHRRPMAAVAWSAPDAESARAGSSPWERSLDGDWRFRLVDRPESAPEGWTESDHDDAAWATTAVPGCWTMDDAVADGPHYTNIVMPFGGDPGEVPEANPTGLYRTTFARPRGWARRRTLLEIGGAESAAAVWCNGAFVGLSTDSRLAATFDLGAHLVAGTNVLAVMVVRWSAGTWLEDQDHWFHAGLHRSVRLRSVGRTHTRDVRVVGDLDAAGVGHLELAVDVDGESAGWTVEADLERLATGRSVLSAPMAGPVPQLDRRDHVRESFSGYHHPGPVVRLTSDVARVRAWSPEDPHRYRLLVTLRDPEGAVAEVVPVMVGFRRVERAAREIRLNGAAPLLRGVNRHDHHPDTGKVLTDAELRDEVAAIKRAGFNALRTAHYPNDPVLLDLCDELGLWVIDEANVETHARWAELAYDVRYEAAYVERVRRLVQRDRNHPSIIIWSLGNEAGYGPVHDAAAAWVRATDPTRLVQYEGAVMERWPADPWAIEASSATDVVCPMYPSVEDLAAWAETTAGGTKPLVMCEYSHAMGNSNGGLDRYWELIESTPGLQGGFIWDWRDQGLRPPAELGGSDADFFAYGGMFGDQPSDGDFCCNGLVGPDGAPHPAVEEHRFLARPVVTEAVDPTEGRVSVTNRRSFTDLTGLRGELEVSVDGEVVARHRVPAPECGPGETVMVRTDARPPQAPPGAEVLATVRWRLTGATAWAPRGWVVAWDQFPMPSVAPRDGTPTRRSVRLEPTVDTESALVASLRLGDRELLAAPVTTALWRAPIDNDGVSVGPMAAVAGVRRQWLDAGLDSITRRAVSARRRRDGDAVVWSLRSVLRPGGGAEVEHRQKVRVESDGVILLTERWSVPASLDDLPRIGLRWSLGPGLDRLRWFGPGPHETMPDRVAGAVLGRWSSTVAEQDVPYVLPQHHGSHVAPRWFALVDENGRGLVVAGLDLGAFDASHHRLEDLTAAEHRGELRPTPEVHVHLDAALRGAGTAACGPDVEPRFRVGSGTHRLRWAMAGLTRRTDPAVVAADLRSRLADL